MEDAEKIIKYIEENDMIHKFFKKVGAKLFITKKDYAYLKVGNMCYYFHGDTKEREIELVSGEKVTQSVVPYDGYETNSCIDECCNP